MPLCDCTIEIVVCLRDSIFLDSNSFYFINFERILFSFLKDRWLFIVMTVLVDIKLLVASPNSSN